MKREELQNTVKIFSQDEKGLFEILKQSLNYWK